MMMFLEDTKDIRSHWLATFNEETQVIAIFGKFLIIYHI